MSIDPGSPYRPPLGEGAPPTNRSRGVMLGLGIGCGVLLLLCCGGVAMLIWLFRSSTNQDPAAVRRIAAEIAEVPLPPEFEPKFSIDMWFGFKGERLKGAVFESKKQGVFMMGTYSAQMSDAEGEQLMEQMSGNFRMQDGGANEKLDIIESKTVKLSMRGKPASFKFAKVENTETKVRFWQVAGTFQGKQGPAMIKMIVPLGEYSDKDIMHMLEKTK